MKPPSPQEIADTGAITLAALIASEQPAAPPPPIEAKPGDPVREIGGRRDGPDPTRYGDWEKNGRCIDF